MQSLRRELFERRANKAGEQGDVNPVI